MYADTIYGGAKPKQPSGTSAPSPDKAGQERSIRTSDAAEEGDPVLALVVMIGLAILLGFLSVRIELGGWV